MLQAKRLKVLPTKKEEIRFGESLGRGRISSSVEYWKFGNRAARAIDGEHLLATASRTLEDPHVAGLHHIKSGASVAFGEDNLARLEVSAHQTSREECKLLLGEVGENGHSPQYRERSFLVCAHATILRTFNRGGLFKPAGGPLNPAFGLSGELDWLSKPQQYTLADALNSLKQGIARRFIGNFPPKPKPGLSGHPLFLQ